MIVERVLNLGVQDLWDVLSDTAQMVLLDPSLDSYEPENGTLEAGTLNFTIGRLGPLRVRMTTRTEVLEPPTRARFATVDPARPVRITVEDTLMPADAGTRYVIRISASPAGPVGRILAPLLVRFMARSRTRFLNRLEAHVSLP